MAFVSQASQTCSVAVPDCGGSIDIGVGSSHVMYIECIADVAVVTLQDFTILSTARDWLDDAGPGDLGVDNSATDEGGPTTNDIIVKGGVYVELDDAGVVDKTVVVDS